MPLSDVTGLAVCVAGSGYALHTKDWDHFIHCVVHFGKHMYSGQVGVNNNEKSN